MFTGIPHTFPWKPFIKSSLLQCRPWGLKSTSWTPVPLAWRSFHPPAPSLNLGASPPPSGVGSQLRFVCRVNHSSPPPPPHLSWEEGWMGGGMRGAINMYDELVAGSINNPGSQSCRDGDQAVEIPAPQLHSAFLYWPLTLGTLGTPPSSNLCLLPI